MAASAGAHQSSNSSLLDRLRPRYTAIFVLMAGIFGSLTAKLWSMQVLSSEEYRAKSDENQLTTVKTSAPRGRIFDTEGIVIVDNEITPTILANPEVAEDHSVLMRLSALTGLPYAVVRQRILDSSGGAQASARFPPIPVPAMWRSYRSIGTRSGRCGGAARTQGVSLQRVGVPSRRLHRHGDRLPA